MDTNVPYALEHSTRSPATSSKLSWLFRGKYGPTSNWLPDRESSYTRPPAGGSAFRRAGSATPRCPVPDCRWPRRVVAKVEHHPGELFPRVRFIVTNLTLPSRAVVRFYNKRGTAGSGSTGAPAATAYKLLETLLKRARTPHLKRK